MGTLVLPFLIFWATYILVALYVTRAYFRYSKEQEFIARLLGRCAVLAVFWSPPPILAAIAERIIYGGPLSFSFLWEKSILTTIIAWPIYIGLYAAILGIQKALENAPLD